jgi:hypothetical protein
MLPGAAPVFVTFNGTSYRSNMSALWFAARINRRCVSIVVKVMLLLLPACGPSISRNASPPPENVQDMISNAAAKCRDDPSEKGAQLARKKIPESPGVLSTQTWLYRLIYLRDNRWAIFDLNRDSRFEINEYHDWIWASFLIGATPGSCILTKVEFYNAIIGRPNEPRNGWRRPSSLAQVDAIYRIYDVNGRGFLVKEDLRVADIVSFKRADVFHRGYLIPDQTF